jgi:hypothetical protein
MSRHDPEGWRCCICDQRSRNSREHGKHEKACIRAADAERLSLVAFPALLAEQKRKAA